MAHVLKALGSRHVLVVHSKDGLDEISIGGQTYVAELKNNIVTCYEVCPEDFGLKRENISQLAIQSADESLAIINSIFDGELGAARDIVALNAGAAIYAADLASSLDRGIEQAQTLIDNGKAKQKLQDFITCSNT